MSEGKASATTQHQRPVEAASWHEALRAADAQARDAEDARMRLAAVEQLEKTLARANADRIALREAVAVRDRILVEQRAALAERDSALASLRTSEAGTSSAVVGRAARFARRCLRRARRTVGRALRGSTG